MHNSTCSLNQLRQQTAHASQELVLNKEECEKSFLSKVETVAQSFEKNKKNNSGVWTEDRLLVVYHAFIALMQIWKLEEYGIHRSHGITQVLLGHQQGMLCPVEIRVRLLPYACAFSCHEDVQPPPSAPCLGIRQELFHLPHAPPLARYDREFWLL